MELKKGYKQTEVGVIPEQWDASTFAELFNVTAGGDFDPKKSSAIQDDVCRFPVYSNALTNQGLFGYCSYADHQAGSITITARGMIGSANFRNHPFTAIGRVLVLQPKGELVGSFFSEVINNRVKFAIESTGVPQLTAPQIASYKLPVPPLPEQSAIAAALSDVDGLIGGLEQLIAKKRDLKQAAMQQLLTGKKRLAGFCGEWAVKRLGDVLKVRHGKSQHGITASDGKYPILASGGEIGRTNAFIYDKPSVLIGRKGTIDSPQYVDSPFWTVDTLFFTEISNEANAKFVFYKFTMIRWRSYNEASGVPSLNAKTIENIEIQIPLLPEQTAIAELLSDMDAEIAALEQRRDKTRTLKQGMMQELLTGKTRLL